MNYISKFTVLKSNMALMKQNLTPIVLKITRCEPYLVCPAQPTPREQKTLSDIDDQEALRVHVPVILFYRELVDRKLDPVQVFKDALAKALVFYYPLAGRLVEGPNRKFVVNCTGEGVLFIEAESDAIIEDFGDEIHPPFPLEDLLYDIPGTNEMIGAPLLILQVTRLRCRGFVVALKLNHTLTDATGIMQFMNAVGEIARGFTAPSIVPMWERERLTSRDPPRVIFQHHEYEQLDNIDLHQFHQNAHSGLVQQTFLFGPTHIAALRRNVPSHFKQSYSTFDLLTATLWRCRTRAIGLPPDGEVRLLFAVNARNKFNPPLRGYYGNACAYPVVCVKARDICDREIDYIIELIKKAKAKINEEYMRSVIDLMVTKDRPHVTVSRTYVVSDLRHLGFCDVDFGWGKPVFGGLASNDTIPTGSFFTSYKNRKGESVIMTLISLQPATMEKFIKELQGMLQT